MTLPRQPLGYTIRQTARASSAAPGRARRGEMAATDEFVTLGEIRRAAVRTVPTGAWNYLVGGADTEATLRNNRRALGRYVFVPRVLRDVSQLDTTTTFLGLPLAMPIMIAPMGSMFLLHPDGDLALARAAGQMGTIYWLSTMTRWEPEEVAAAATGPLIFQLYWRGDHAWAEALIRRIEAAGFRGLALTVDVPMYG